MQVSYPSDSLSLNKGPWSQFYWSKYINLVHAYCQLSMITVATWIHIQDHISSICSHTLTKTGSYHPFLVFAILTGDTWHLAATISFPFPNWWQLLSVILQSGKQKIPSSLLVHPWNWYGKGKQSAGKGEMYWKELEPQHHRVELRRRAVELRRWF